MEEKQNQGLNNSGGSFNPNSSSNPDTPSAANQKATPSTSANPDSNSQPGLGLNQTNEPKSEPVKPVEPEKTFFEQGFGEKEKAADEPQPEELPKADIEPGLDSGSPHYPISDEPKKDFLPKDQEEASTTNTIITVVVVIVIIALGIWYFSRDQGPAGESDNQLNDNVNIVVNDQQEEGEVKIINSNQDNEGLIEAEKAVKIAAYYNNTKKDPGMPDCSKVYSLEREAEKKYDSEVINTVRGLLTPLSESEKAAGWVSSIPPSTFLKYVTITNGAAKVNFTAGLNQISGSCAVTAARAQITQTLLQFPYVTSVVICVEDNCNQDEILQP